MNNEANVENRKHMVTKPEHFKVRAPVKSMDNSWNFETLGTLKYVNKFTSIIY